MRRLEASKERDWSRQIKWGGRPRIECDGYVLSLLPRDRLPYVHLGFPSSICSPRFTLTWTAATTLHHPTSNQSSSVTSGRLQPKIQLAQSNQTIREFQAIPRRLVAERKNDKKVDVISLVNFSEDKCRGPARRLDWTNVRGVLWCHPFVYAFGMFFPRSKLASTPPPNGAQTTEREL